MKIDIVQCHRMNTRHIEPREFKFAEILTSFGVKVTIHTMISDGLDLPLIEQRRGVNCIFYPVKKIEINNSVQLCEELKINLLKQNSDVVLFKGLGYKIIEDVFESIKNFSKLGIIIGGKVTHKNLIYFDYVFIESPNQKEKILESYPNLQCNFLLMPKLIDWESVKRYRNIPKKFDVCNIGQFIQRKNQIALTPLFEKYDVVLVGGGPELDNFKSSITVNNKVFFTGQIDRSDVYRIASSSHLNVHTSLHEGVPRAAIEAFACGVPLVGFNSTLGDVFGDLSFVNLTDEYELKEVIDNLLSDPKMLNMLSDSAREWAFEMHGPHRLLKLVEDFIEIINPD
jgi:glycosyltransferase involved in cell wall biosynthesis